METTSNDTESLDETLTRDRGSLYTKEDTQELKARWFELHKPVTSSTFDLESLAQKYWQIFDSSYREPQRYYHNFFHLKRLYEFYNNIAKPYLESSLEQFRLEGGDLEIERGQKAFLYSLWFHDAIYDPKRKDNEELSADLFNQYAEQNPSIDYAQKHLVTQMILATIKHQIPEQLEKDLYSTSVTKLFLDADLSVLGWNRSPDYEIYAWAIWKEYEHYGREKYCEGRPAVLQRMLTQREHLYFTPLVQQQFEATAHENVNWEIQYLEKELAFIQKSKNASSLSASLTAVSSKIIKSTPK